MERRPVVTSVGLQLHRRAIYNKKSAVRAWCAERFHDLLVACHSEHETPRRRTLMKAVTSLAYKLTHLGFRIIKLVNEGGVTLAEAARLVAIIEKADKEWQERQKMKEA